MFILIKEFSSSSLVFFYYICSNPNNEKNYGNTKKNENI